MIGLVGNVDAAMLTEIKISVDCFIMKSCFSLSLPSPVTISKSRMTRV